MAELCGAESACVVNNCAAALVLIAHHFTKRKPEVIISRGELVQIGGGFRIGEILESTGATLREVGSTNKTTLSDYARAVSSKTAMILKVHRSNFFMSGFVASPDECGNRRARAQKTDPICRRSRQRRHLGHRKTRRDRTRTDSSGDVARRRGSRLFQRRQIVWRPAGRNHRRQSAFCFGAEARTALPCVALRQAGVFRVAGDDGITSRERFRGHSRSSIS